MVTNNGVDSAILKAKHGSDIRKSELHHIHDLNFNDLILMMQRIFQIKASTNILLKYRDSDGDWITLANDDDINFALRHEPSLFIEVFTDNDQSSRPSSPLNSDSVLTTRVSGISVNDEVSSLLLKNESVLTPTSVGQQQIPPYSSEVNQQQPPQVSTPVTQSQNSFESNVEKPQLQSFGVQNLNQQQQQTVPPTVGQQQQPPQLSQYSNNDQLQQTNNVPTSASHSQNQPPLGFDHTNVNAPPTSVAQVPLQQAPEAFEKQQFQAYTNHQQPPVLPPQSVSHHNYQPQHGYGNPNYPQQQQNSLTSTPVHNDQQQQQHNLSFGNQHHQPIAPPPTSIGQQIVSPYGNPQQPGLSQTSIGQPQQAPPFGAQQPPQNSFGYGPPPPVSSIIGGSGVPGGNPFSRGANPAFARPPSNFGNRFQ